MTGTFTLVERPSGLPKEAWLSRQLPFVPYDKATDGFYGDDMADGREEPQTGDDTFASWLRRARTDAGWGKMAATEALAEVGIRERTYFRWESGDIAKPDPAEIRKACLRLGIDPREAAIALGIVTREEMDLPPQEPALPRSLRRILQLLKAEQVPENAKKRLLKIIDDAVDFWFETFGLPNLREPSADERAKGKTVGPKR